MQWSTAIATRCSLQPAEKIFILISGPRICWRPRSPLPVDQHRRRPVRCTWCSPTHPARIAQTETSTLCPGRQSCTCDWPKRCLRSTDIRFYSSRPWCSLLRSSRTFPWIAGKNHVSWMITLNLVIQRYITWTPKIPKMMKNVQQMRTMFPIGLRDDNSVWTTSFRPGALLMTLRGLSDRNSRNT